jgi:DNA (cytosine-5)-methyltransferase 1
MKFVSLFSGIEAASVASAELNWQAVAFSEIEPFPCRLLAHKYPQTPNLGDITKVDWSAWRGKADIVVGGSPCQAFSTAGNRNGLDDERGNLTLEYCKAVHAIKPQWIFWENVPGVLTDKTNAFGCLLAELTGADEPLTSEEPNNGCDLFGGTSEPDAQSWKSAGWSIATDDDHYSVAWRVLDAQHFGVSQHRERVFLVGRLGALRRREVCEVLFECSRSTGYTQPSKNERKESAARAKNSARVFSFLGNKGGLTGGLGIREELASTLTTQDNQQFVLFENHRREGRYTEMGVCPTLDAGAGEGGNNTPFIVMAGANSRAEISERVAPTLLANHDKTFFAGANQVRRMTPREYERLQGFPDDYTLIDESTKDAPRYKALGNSWAVPCVRWIFERIDKVNKEVT